MRKSCVLYLLCLYNLLLGQTTAQIDEVESNVNYLYLRMNVNCTDRENVYERKLHANYWTLVNYIRANYSALRCSTSVTYTTHGDYRYLGNVVPLVVRWRAPISLALYAPGDDFQPTVLGILWLQQCHPQRQLIRQWVNFHIYFDVNHMPRFVHNQWKLRRMQLKCRQTPPFANVRQEALYRRQMKLGYPVNAGRNIAKEASQTHYVLASDIELYPTPGLVHGFLRMLTANRHLVNPTRPTVFPLNIFEVQENATVPSTKVQLTSQLGAGQAVPFHTYVCPSCNMAPHLQEWLSYKSPSTAVQVFSVSRRVGLWDPVYIGTTQEPPYDERLSWEGMYDKETHSFALCLIGYQLRTLDNAFLVHKPGINRGHNDRQRNWLAMKIQRRIRNKFIVEYIFKYGFHFNCIL